jgi:hypothetical protein
MMEETLHDFRQFLQAAQGADDFAGLQEIVRAISGQFIAEAACT